MNPLPAFACFNVAVGNVLVSDANDNRRRNAEVTVKLENKYRSLLGKSYFKGKSLFHSSPSAPIRYL